jgi:hypothetical protein
MNGIIETLSNLSEKHQNSLTVYAVTLSGSEGSHSGRSFALGSE